MEFLDIKKVIYNIHTLENGDKEVTIDLDNGDNLVDNGINFVLTSRTYLEAMSTERIVKSSVDFDKLSNVLAKCKSKRYLMLWLETKGGKCSYLVGTRDIDGTIKVNPTILDVTYIGSNGEVDKWLY